RALVPSDAAAVPLGHRRAQYRRQLRTATKLLFRGLQNAYRRQGQARFRHRSRVPELTRSTQRVHGSSARAYRGEAAALWAQEVNWLYPRFLRENRNESERTLESGCQRRPL